MQSLEMNVLGPRTFNLRVNLVDSLLKAAFAGDEGTPITDLQRKEDYAHWSTGATCERYRVDMTHYENNKPIPCYFFYSIVEGERVYETRGDGMVTIRENTNDNQQAA